jgi:FkbM family methyltransferase
MSALFSFSRWMHGVARLAGLQTLGEHTVFVPALRNDFHFWDIGANHGDFSRRVLEWPDAKGWALEPSPENFSKIPSPTRLQTLCLAASGHDGVVTFYLSTDSQSCSTRSEIAAHHSITGELEVPCVCYRTLRQKHGWPRPDLLKLDIEGSEIEFLGAMTDSDLREIPQITLEFHHVLQKQDLYDASRELEIRLERLGFVRIDLTTPLRTDVLFLQPVLVGRSAFQAFWQTVLRRLVFPLRDWKFRYAFQVQRR